MGLWAKVPSGARFIMNMLNSAGHEAYLVGGCVRDMLLKSTPKDWDICTDAQPEEVQELFDDGEYFTVVPTGLKHGTLTIVVKGDGSNERFEVTTYRVDGEYSDGRRPDTVSYTTELRDDLSRRDFTVNAMAYSFKTGVVDEFGGLHDMERGLLRCVGVAEDRFNEDSLRILRALRFMATKGFSIEESTDRAVRSMYPLMATLSAERIMAEMSKLLCGADAFRVLMDYTEVFTFLMPELAPMVGCTQSNPYHVYDVWEHTCRVVAGAPQDEVIRLAAFFHDTGKPSTKTTGEDGVDHFYGHPKVSADIAESVLRRLKNSNDLIDKVVCLVGTHDAEMPNKSSIKRMLNKIGPEALKSLIKLKEADVMAQSQHSKDTKLQLVLNMQTYLDEVEADNSCFKRSDLAVNGSDLVKLGFTQGKELGEVLDALLHEVLDDILVNEREVLLAKALKIKEQVC